MDIQTFFIKYHYISQKEVAARAGISYGIMRRYACGLLKCPPERVKLIQQAVREIGKDLAKAKIN